MPDLPRRPGYLRVPCPGAGSVPITPTRESAMEGPRCRECGQAVELEDGVGGRTQTLREDEDRTMSVPNEPVTYRCAECGWEGETAWSDEEARAEAEANGFDLGGEPMAVICDDCYQSRPWSNR